MCSQDLSFVFYPRGQTKYLEKPDAAWITAGHGERLYGWRLNSFLPLAAILRWLVCLFISKAYNIVTYTIYYCYIYNNKTTTNNILTMFAILVGPLHSAENRKSPCFIENGEIYSSERDIHFTWWKYLLETHRQWWWWWWGLLAHACEVRSLLFHAFPRLD